MTDTQRLLQGIPVIIPSNISSREVTPWIDSLGLSSTSSSSSTNSPARDVTIEFVTEDSPSPPGTNDPFATFQRQLIGAVAELERSLIWEQQRGGIELAKQRGTYKGCA